MHGPVANLVRADAECALAVGDGSRRGGAEHRGGHAERRAQRHRGAKAHGRGPRHLPPAGRDTRQCDDERAHARPGFVGVAYELVRFDERYKNIFANLLGRTVVAETLADAVRMSKQSGNSLRIVTLDGQLINAGGSMTGGSAAKGSGILSRANELEKLKKARKLREKEKDCADELSRAKSGLAAVRYQLDMALEDQAELKSRQSSLEAEMRTTDGSAAQLRQLLAGLSGDSEQRRSLVQTHERRIADFPHASKEKETQLAGINEKIAAIKGEIADIAPESWSLRAAAQNDKDAQQRNSDILDLERRSARIEQKKLAADMEEKAASRQALG